LKKLLILTGFILFFPQAIHAADMSIDVQAGYGVLKFEEHEDYRGDVFVTDSDYKAILLGLSGEYSFAGHGNIYTGINADWAFGLKDREIWYRNDTEVQQNDMELSMQFYDLRIGYKNRNGNLYYRLYISGGWDGLTFTRNKYVWLGNALTKLSVEDMSLWKAGIGTGIGFRKNKWFLDGSLAYSYYPYGETVDSSLSDTTFDTDGYRLNIDLGLTRKINDSLDVHAGGNYMLQKLNGDTWRTKMQISAGVVNLRYGF